VSERRKVIQQGLAALGVVFSLLFVGYEIRQNTAAVRGATMQSMSDAHSEFMLAMSLDQDFADVVLRVFSGASTQDLAPHETLQMNMNLVGWVGMLENTYLQHRLGLVSDVVFESYGWNNAIHQTTYFGTWWTGSSLLFVSPEFKSFFESRVRIGP